MVVEELIGHVLRYALSTAETEHGGTASRVALTFPASWGPLRQGVLVAGAELAGIADPLLVTEPEAAAAFYASERPVPDGALVAVFDFGGGTLDIAVVHRVDGGFVLLGNPTGDDELGGSNIDELVFAHVLDQLDPPTRAEIDGDLGARAALFWECVDAKETLSFDPFVDVKCVTDSGRQLVRVTRELLEDLIGDLVERSLVVLRAGLAAADVEESELHSVLLVGGTSRVPMIARRLEAALPCTIAVDTDPKTSVALGASKLAKADLRSSGTPTGPDDAVDLGIDGLGPATLIGRGGYSSVYRARQESLDRDVAIKLILGTGFDLTARRRFEQECQAVGRLSEHPNIVTVYQSGVPDDRPAFLVMSYVPGGSYQDELDAGRPLPWPDVVALGTKIAGALQAAHEARIFHCDVKPANILLSPHGEPLLADFGLARVAERTGTQSITGLAGTPHYSPPEVFDGAAPAPERDIYGLAATLHALIVGRPPIDVDSQSILALMRHVASDDPANLRDHGVPGPVADVIAKGLAKDPTERLSSAAEFGAALAAAAEAADGEPVVPATPVKPLFAPAQNPTERDPIDDEDAPPHRRFVALVAAAVLAVIAVIAVFVTRGDDDPSNAATTLDSTAPPATAGSSDPTPATTADSSVATDSTVPAATSDPSGPPVGLELLGTADVAPDVSIGGEPFVAISALMNGSDDGAFRAIRSVPRFPERLENAPVEPVVFDLTIDLSDGRLDDGDVTSEGSVPLLDADGMPYGPELDVEGATTLPDGSFVVVSEGEGDDPGELFVHRFTAGGTFLQDYDIPDWYLGEDGSSGVDRGGFNSIAALPGGTFVVGAEGPLLQEHDRTDATGEKIVRFLEFDTTTGEAVAEWGYALDRIPPENDPGDPNLVGGVVEFLATGDRSLLVLERSWSTGTVGQVLYHVDLPEGVEPSPNAPPPLDKHLVLDARVLDLPRASFQSAALGPTLDDGRSTVVFVSDSEFRETPTTFMALAITTEADGAAGFARASRIDRFDIEPGGQDGGSRFEAIDGLDYHPSMGQFVALKEPAPAEIAAAEPQRRDPVLFQLDIAAAGAAVEAGSENSSPEPIGALTNDQGVPYGAELDVEGLAVLDDGSFVVVSEGAGENDTASGPFVHRFDAEGRFVNEFDLPTWVLPSDDGGSGFQPRAGPHGVAVRPGAPSEVVMIIEAPLIQDVTDSGPNAERLVRMISFDAASGQPTRQWGYPLDVVESEDEGPDVERGGLIVDIAAVDDRVMLVLELSAATDPRQRRLYQVEFDDGIPPDVSRPAALPKRGIELPDDGSFDEVVLGKPQCRTTGAVGSSDHRTDDELQFPPTCRHRY